MSQSLTKADLIGRIAQNTGMKKVEAEKALTAFLDSVRITLKKGGKITLTGFGSFDVAKRAARVGRDPQTQKPIQIPASKTVRFRPGKFLKEAVN